jgi:hypothetical protein
MQQPFPGCIHYVEPCESVKLYSDGIGVSEFVIAHMYQPWHGAVTAVGSELVAEGCWVPASTTNQLQQNS